MNDLQSTNQKQSIFKVFKDKLTGYKKSENKDYISLEKDNNTITNNKLSIDSFTQKKSIPDEMEKNISEQATTTKTQPINTTTTNQLNTLPKTTNKSSIYSIIIKSIIIIIATLLIGYVIVNSKALLLKYDYWDKVTNKNLKWSELHPVTLVQAQTTAQKLDENYLYLPTLGIQAPVVWGAQKEDINNILSTHLAHYASSALPDDAGGNIYITGRTSGPIWSSSELKTVFTLLNKAKIDDVITIIYKNNIYSYKITEIDYFGNKNIVIAPGEETKSILNLLAKYPVGLNWRTLRIKAILYKIESNLSASIEDKIKQLPENYNEIELDPIEVKPTPTAVPIPINEQLPNPDLLPDHFLPSI